MRGVITLNQASELNEKIAPSHANPVIRETMVINVDGKKLIVYKDELAKKIYEQLSISIYNA